MGLLIPNTLAVVPVLIGPLSTLIALLPVILLGLLRLFRPSGAKKLALFFWHQKVFTCLLCGAIWFFIWGPELGLWPKKAIAASTAAGTDWASFRGGPERRGALPGGEDPTLGESIWTNTSDKVIYSSPTVVGDRVYVATVVKLNKFFDRGAIVCLNAATGEEIWRYAPHGYRATFSSPAVCGDYLVCGEGLHWVQDARIVCLDLKDGKLLWELRTNYHLESSPCIYKDNVYIGAGMDGYYCVALKPGADGKPVIRWHLDPAKYKDCETPPLVVDDVAYLGVGGQERSDKGGLLAVTAGEGKELWRLSTPYPVFAPPAFENGKLYIGMGIGDFVNDAEEVRRMQADEMHSAGKSAAEIAAMEKETVPVGEVWCIDAKTHLRDWKCRVGRTVLGAAVPGERGVYFGSRDGNFYCVSKADGKTLHQFNAREPIVTSPALGKEHVYFSTMNGHMYCLRADSLELVWDMPLGSGSGFLSSPALAHNHIYIGTIENGVRCIGRVGEKQPPLWRNGERGGVVDTSFLPPKLDLSWRYPKDPATHITITAPLLPHAGFIFAADVCDNKAELVKLSPDRNLDDTARRVWSHEFNNLISIPPAAVGDEIYVSDGNTGKANRVLASLSAETGALNWSFVIGAQGSGKFAVDPKRVFVWNDSQQVTCLDRKSGQKIWASTDPLGYGVGAPELTDGLAVLATQAGIRVLDDDTGKLLWTAALVDAPTSGPMVWKNSVVVTTSNGVECRSLSDGSLKWAQPIGACATPPIPIDDKAAVITGAGVLCVFSLMDGKILSQVPQADPVVPPLLAAGNLVYRVGKGLNLLEVETGKTSQWYGVDWGQPCSPFVMQNQQLCFGSVSKGLICLRPRKQ